MGRIDGDPSADDDQAITDTKNDLGHGLLANPMILPRVFRTLNDFALPFSVICTPKDMLEEYGDASAT